MNQTYPISSMAKENNNSSSNNQQTQTWSTWEELLLACAVKRHGFKSWDSVAMEVRAKTSLPHLPITAQNCEQKYCDLKRRFSITKQQGQDHVVEQEEETENSSKTGDKVDNIPWLEELRKVRVAELRREVQRYDVSILSLQLKVKRLEEDRERSLQANGSVEPKPDLENDSKREGSGNVEIKPEKPTGKKSISGEESDRENRSVNESNSTGSNRKTGGGRAGDAEPGPVRVGSGEPAPVLKQPTGEDSCSRGSGVSHSDELDDSETQLSGDLQSSACLGRKRKRKETRRRKEIFGGGGGDDGIKGASVKSEPLLGFLEMIRVHHHSSLFERRLQSQESDDYKNLVRQHLDFQTIQTKLEQGLYSSCTLSLYRDLLLLFNNAIVFFPKSSLESLTAHELRNLTSNEMKKETQKSDSSQGPPAAPSSATTHQAKPELERSDSLLARQKSSAPLIVCRKRSSVSMKPSSSSSFGQKAEQQHSDDKKPAPDQKPEAKQSLKEKEKPVTGTRSSRRSNSKNPTKANSNSNSNSNSNVTSNKKQNTNSGLKAGSADKQETPKTEKKKTEALASDKKRSVVDFLKRIKKNSPVETPKKGSRGGEQKKNSSGKKDAGKERVLRSNGDKKKVKEETSPSKKNTGRPKKGAEAATVPASGKRGREGGGGGGGGSGSGSGGGSGGKEKLPRKRARR